MLLKVKNMIDGCTAARAESVRFGASEGVRKTTRVVFAECDDRRHYVAALKNRPGFFESFFYKPIDVIGLSGKRETIWVNQSSFEKRFDAALQDFAGLKDVSSMPALAEKAPLNPDKKQPKKDLLMAELSRKLQNKPVSDIAQKPQGADYKVCGPNEFLNLTTGEKISHAALIRRDLKLAPLCRKLLSDEFEHAKVDKEKLIPQQAALTLPTLQELTKDASLQASDIEEMLKIAEERRSLGSKLYVYPRGKEGFKRPMLVTPEKTYILLTAKEDPVLGEGTSKKVRFAIDAATGKKYALAVNKEWASIRVHKEVMDNEVAILRSLSEERGVCHLIDDIRVDNRRYFILEHCDRGNLAEALEKQILTSEQKQQIALDIAEALGALHRKGIVYRDVKPENVLLYTDANGILHAKLCDFGLASSLKKQKSLREVVGTPPHFSPELARSALNVHKFAVKALEQKKQKKYNPYRFEHQNRKAMEKAAEDVAKASQKTADVWALGTVYYSLFHPKGKEWRPELPDNYASILTINAATTEEEVSKILDQSGIDASVRALLGRLLKVSPEERTISMDEIVQEVARL